MSDADHRQIPLGAMRLSLGVGLAMLGMKLYAYFLTGSSAIFSDAAESVVHNLAVGFALYSQWYSNKPSDRSHLYGHEDRLFLGRLRRHDDHPGRAVHHRGRGP